MTKFYPLEHEEWVKQASELTLSEINVLYYIRTLDPYSNGVKVNAAAIALDLKVNRSTVSRALKSLTEKNYIGLEILEANVTIKGRGALLTKQKAEVHESTKNDSQDVASVPSVLRGCNKNESEDVAPVHDLLPECTPCCVDAPICAPTQQVSPETLTQRESYEPKILKINKTYKDQIDQEKCLNAEVVANVTEKVVSKSATAPIAIAEDPDRELKKFIIKTVEAQKNSKLSRPDEYATKCLENDREHWRSLFMQSLRPKHKPQERRMDLWSVEQTIGMALKGNNLEFAIFRFNQYPEFHDQILQKHTQWKEVLC
jgi:DNA-binding MarR family transcriptional regulator